MQQARQTVCKQHMGDALVWVSCWQCDGAGGFHYCEDTCCCLDPEGELDKLCDICDGEGEYPVCPTCLDEQDAGGYQWGS